MDPMGMQLELKRNRPQIDTVLTFAVASHANGDLLANHLCGPLSAYAERFKPGSDIDERTLDGTRTVMGAEPEYGLGISAYLLLEVARQKSSATFTRRALNTLDGVVRAAAYFAERLALHRHPELADQIAQEKRELHGPGIPLGAEVAWTCEQFMVWASETEDCGIPEPGMTVVEDYCRWRQETMANEVTPYCLYATHQYQTMAYAERLADALAPPTE